MDIILHHYPRSPFSEKVRAMLGYLNLSWKSVTIPVILPRPLLTPLSGGYRRTPIMQIGADVYCDSNIIARKIDSLSTMPSLYPEENAFACERISEWADNQLFRIAVSLSFQPKAVAQLVASMGQENLKAFMADREKLREGGTLERIQVSDAEAYLESYLVNLSKSLNQDFVFGDAPTIADFSIYHALWMIVNNDVISELVLRHPLVASWYERMVAFGHGQHSDMSEQLAYDLAKSESPLSVEGIRVKDFDLGQMVSVMPTDYGKIAVEGKLLSVSGEEVILARVTDELGEINLHFPRLGFNIKSQ